MRTKRLKFAFLGPVLASLGLCGCAALTQPAPTLERFGGTTIKVRRSPFNSDLIVNSYNGELDDGPLGSGRRVRATAWFDYDVQFARYYLENIDSLSQLRVGTAALSAPKCVAAPPDFAAGFLRYSGSANLLMNAAGLRSLQSPGLAGASVLIGILGDKNLGYSIRVSELWRRRVGTTLTLVSFSETHTAENDGIDMALALRLISASTAPGRSATGTLPLSGSAGPWGMEYAEYLSIRAARPEDPSMLSTPSAPPLVRARIHAHDVITESPVATLYPKGRTVSIEIPHVYYQDRPDGIRSARELYENTLANNPTLPSGWFAIYTDRDEKGEWKIFVTRKGDERTLVFDIPAKPPG